MKAYFLLLVFILLNIAICSPTLEKETFFKNIKDHVKKAESDVNKLFKQENSNIKYSNSRLGFIHGFLASIYVIIISELGDKTFFIAAIMSIRNPRLVVYAGAMLALASMTVLSAALGMATTVIPRKLTYYISGFLFLIFGLKMLRDAYKMSPSDTQEEYEEVQAELRNRDTEYALSKQLVTDPETGVMTVINTKPSPQLPEKSTIIKGVTSKLENLKKALYMLFSKVFVESFVLTFLAEWGDRSQMTTIVLAATKDVVGVIVGGTLGHALCTGIAVISGRFIAQKIPVRALTFIGGVTFLLFAVHTFISDPLSNS